MVRNIRHLLKIMRTFGCLVPTYAAPFTFHYEELEMDGVKTLQFRVKPEVLSYANPENACYCKNVEDCVKESTSGDDAWDLSDCTHCLDGTLNLMGCQGAPVIASLPHFLNGDEKLNNSIAGLLPDPSLHTTYINVEPYSGVALDAHKRLQINVPLMPNQYISVLKNVKEVLFPVLWVDEGATVEGENMKKLKKQLVTPFLAVDIAVGFMIGVGAVLIISITVYLLLCVKS